jgi:hypothetical protein
MNFQIPSSTNMNSFPVLLSFFSYVQLPFLPSLNLYLLWFLSLRFEGPCAAHGSITDQINASLTLNGKTRYRSVDALAHGDNLYFHSEVAEAALCKLASLDATTVHGRLYYYSTCIDVNGDLLFTVEIKYAADLKDFLCQGQNGR